jgi:hypothetical protein
MMPEIIHISQHFFGSAQEFDEVQAGATFLKGQISVHSAVCETTT